jgi:hypothetical protein
MGWEIWPLAVRGSRMWQAAHVMGFNGDPQF